MIAPNTWFNRQLDSFIARVLPKSDVFQLGRFGGIDAWPVLEIMMEQSIIHHAMTEHGCLTCEDFRDFPKMITGACAIYKSKRLDSLVLKLGFCKENQAVAVPMRRVTHPAFGPIYSVKSFYPKPEYQWKLWDDAGLLLRGQKKEPSTY